MPYKCCICEEEFMVTRERFPVVMDPVVVCNRCSEVIWTAYHEVKQMIKDSRKEMWTKVSHYIFSLKLDESTKDFMIKVLKAYCTDDDNDEHSFEIRGVMSAIFFEDNDPNVVKDWIRLGNFSEEEKSFFMNFLENEDEEIDKIMALIDEHDMDPDPDSDFDEEEYVDKETERFYYSEPKENKVAVKANDKVATVVPNRSVDTFVKSNRNMQDIIAEVLQGIKCQDQGVIQIGRLIYRHMMRLIYNKKHPDTPILTKQNILIIGPTGVGKTATIREYCRILDLPYVEVDMTDITKAGYIGDNLVDSFRRLVSNADGNILWAEKGIMVLDEGDKNAKAGNNSERDPGGQAVMFEMLKKLEGGDIALGGGKYFNTKDLLFICMGTFEEAYEARKKRIGTKRVIGFGEQKKEPNTQELTQPTRFIADDLIKGGAPAEWVGRFPTIVEFDKLNADGYVTVLHDSTKSVFMENKRLMEYAYDGVELIITPEGERKIAEQAVKYDVGVRGLNRILTELLEDVEGKLIMKEYDCKRVIIGENVICE